MKKLLQTATLLLLIVPFYANAEDVSSTTYATSSEQTITLPDGSDTSSATPTVKTFTSCSQAAIEIRDTRIAASRTNYNTAMAKALTDRKNREKAVVALEDESEQKDAIKFSVDMYKNEAKGAQTTLVAARKLAWQTFENDIKKCHDLSDEKAIITTSAAPSNSKDVRDGTVEKKAAPTPSLRKLEKAAEPETKSIKDSFFDSLKALFN